MDFVRVIIATVILGLVVGVIVIQDHTVKKYLLKLILKLKIIKI